MAVLPEIVNRSDFKLTKVVIDEYGDNVCVVLESDDIRQRINFDGSVTVLWTSTKYQEEFGG